MSTDPTVSFVKGTTDPHLLRLTAFPASGGPYERWEMMVECSGEILARGKFPPDPDEISRISAAYHSRPELAVTPGDWLPVGRAVFAGEVCIAIASHPGDVEEAPPGYLFTSTYDQSIANARLMARSKAMVKGLRAMSAFTPPEDPDVEPYQAIAVFCRRLARDLLLEPEMMPAGQQAAGEKP